MALSRLYCMLGAVRNAQCVPAIQSVEDCHLVIQLQESRGRAGAVFSPVRLCGDKGMTA